VFLANRNYAAKRSDHYPAAEGERRNRSGSSPTTISYIILWMADAEHVRILLGEGVAAWNQSRQSSSIHADFSGANLSEANLAGADLQYANLCGTVLSRTNLCGANLFAARLAGADLRWASLRGAMLQLANLTGAVFQATNLEHANLRYAKGLESCQHLAPSSIDYWPLHTLSESKDIPVAFLRGCGLGLDFVEYLVSLQNAPAQVNSCFITYITADSLFARRLHDALRTLRIRCWLDERQIVSDNSNRLGRRSRMWDKELLCCSEHSLTTFWIAQEILAAIDGEREFETPSLWPLDIDGYLFSDIYKDGHPTTGGFQFRFGDINWQSSEVLDFSGWERDNRGFDKRMRMVASLVERPLHVAPGRANRETG